MTANFISADLDAVTLDDRIGKQLVRDFGGERLGLRRFSGGEVQLEILPLTNVFDAVVAERVQRFRNRAALGIENRRFQRDEDSGSHGRLTFSGNDQRRACEAPSVSTGSAPPPLSGLDGAAKTRS